MTDNWKCLFLIDDLDTEFDGFKINDVDFYRLTKSSMSKWVAFQKVGDETLKRMYKEHKAEIEKLGKINFESYKRGHYKAVERNISIFKENMCAEVKVKADDPKRASLKAKSKVDNALNVLRIFKSRCELREPLHAVVKNESSGKERIFWKAEWTRERSWPWACKLEQKEKSQLKNTISRLNPYLQTYDPISINRKINRALRWCAMATQEKDPADRVIKYITALECLFIKERKNKARLLGERVAVILTNSTKIRNKIYCDFKGFYELRNNIVHGDEYQVCNDDLLNLDHATRNLIIEVATIVKKRSFTDIQHLINWLNQNKKGWTPPKC